MTKNQPRTMERKTKSISLRAVLSLTGLVALPPLAIDMYLGALPEISEEFDASVAMSQLTLTGFLLVLGLTQLIIGPITDALGRRRPLLVGLCIFSLGSIAAAIASSVEILLVARLIQGIGGATAVVVANSSVRDYVSGRAATQLFAALATIMAVAPIVAPTVGGYIHAAFGWRAIFWILSGLGALLLVTVLTVLPESLPKAERSRFKPVRSLHGYGKLIQTPSFSLPALALCMMFAVLFTYLGGAPYVYQNHYEMSEVTFGWVFGFSGITILAAPVIVRQISQRYASLSIAITGATIALVGSVGAFITVATDVSVGVVAVTVSIALLGLGLADPPLMGEAMSAPSQSIGQAAALLGAVPFIFGAVATVVVGPLAEKSAIGWTVMIASCALVGWTLIWVARQHAHKSQKVLTTA